MHVLTDLFASLAAASAGAIVLAHRLRSRGRHRLAARRRGDAALGLAAAARLRPRAARGRARGGRPRRHRPRAGGHARGRRGPRPARVGGHLGLSRAGRARARQAGRRLPRRAPLASGAWSASGSASSTSRCRSTTRRPATACWRSSPGGSPVQFGLSMFITDETIAPVALGRAAEDAGFDSIFVPEHTHIPASRESRWPGGGELPREYSHTLDPFVVAQRDRRHDRAPARRHRHRADHRARPDHARPGGGLARPPLRRALRARHRRRLEPRGDAQPRHRPGRGASRVMRERVLAMREIWTHDEASFHGEFVDFDRIWSWPKPVQQPAAGVGRRHRPEGARPGARVRRRLVPEHARPRRARRRASPSCSGAPPTRAASASRSPTSACATPTTTSSRR